MRLHPEEGLIDSDEASNVQHPSRVEVLQLQAPLVEEPMQKPVRGVLEPTLMEGKEGDDIIVLGLQNNLPQHGIPPVHHLLQ